MNSRFLCSVAADREGGNITRVIDEDVQSSVLEIAGGNIAKNYIACPGNPSSTLGIKLPWVVLIVKNLNSFFSFEVQVLDDKNVRRRFRASNFQVIGLLKISVNAGWPFQTVCLHFEKDICLECTLRIYCIVLCRL